MILFSHLPASSLILLTKNQCNWKKVIRSLSLREKSLKNQNPLKKSLSLKNFKTINNMYTGPGEGSFQLGREIS